MEGRDPDGNPGSAPRNAARHRPGTRRCNATAVTIQAAARPAEDTVSPVAPVAGPSPAHDAAQSDTHRLDFAVGGSKSDYSFHSGHFGGRSRGNAE